MSVCLDCRWDPIKQKYVRVGHLKCIKRNKGKEVKDCDCQHRVPQHGAAAAAVLHSGGDSSDAESGEADGNELAAGPEPSTDGTESEPDVASVGIISASLFEEGVRQ